MKRFFICLFFASLMMASCSFNDYKQLEFKSCNVRSVDNIVYGRGTATADVCIEVGVSNPTRSDFQLLTLDAVLYSAKGDKVATASTDEVTVLAPKCDTILPVHVSAVLFNPMATLLGGKLDPETMTVDVDMNVKSGVLKTNIKKEKFPVKTILNK